ncbi:MAG: DNA repair protein RadA [Christensenellales bacterium]
MAKTKTIFYCTNCGHESPKWVGRCPGCGEWNTMEEQPVVKSAGGKTKPWKPAAKPVPLAQVDVTPAGHLQTGIEELDRVLGGGLIEGAVVLVGGEPGVGKSTLLLQACERIARQGKKVLYVSGEESARQIKLRALRLGTLSEDLLVLAETDMEAVCQAMEESQAQLVIIDSIQTMTQPGMASAMGSVSQIRECTASALRIAKTTGATVILVGHVTKEGAIAGPRVLEHMVDTVLYFEGERQSTLRILRAVKNRFGSTNEIGVFAMTEHGMEEMKNPSEVLLSQHTKGVAGSAITCSMEGSRPVLCEIQSLAATTSFGQPRRMATGVDYNRMLLMIAIMERRAGVPLYNRDVYTNVVGGMKIAEPANDLAMVMAIASAATGQPLKEGVAAIGEVGLTGEVRMVTQLERRASECAKMGFTTLLVPKEALKASGIKAGVRFAGVGSVAEALFLGLEPKRKGMDTAEEN